MWVCKCWYIWKCKCSLSACGGGSRKDTHTSLDSCVELSSSLQSLMFHFYDDHSYGFLPHWSRPVFISALMSVSTRDEVRSCHSLLDTPVPINYAFLFLLTRKKNVSKMQFALLLRGNFFQCHIFAMKSVQNLKYFWRSSQNYFVLALFSSL
jgi:hypothetical protein